MTKKPLYYRLPLQALRLVMLDFIPSVRSLIDPSGTQRTFLDSDYLGDNIVLRKIFEGEELGAVGAWRIFFILLDHSITIDADGIGFTYQYKGEPIKGQLVHPMTPKGIEAHHWGRAYGKKPDYLNQCGSYKSWVYAREIGIIPVESGTHAIFMTFLYERRYGKDAFFMENESEYQDIQYELLKKEGVAFKSSVSKKVAASMGSLSKNEIYLITKAGYEIEYI